MVIIIYNKHYNKYNYNLLIILLSQKNQIILLNNT